MHKFYANLSGNIVVQGEAQFEKFLLWVMFEFSLRVISEYLKIPIPKNFNFEKEYVLDDVATKLLRYKCVWPKTNVLRVTNLTLKCLHCPLNMLPPYLETLPSFSLTLALVPPCTWAKSFLT